MAKAKRANNNLVVRIMAGFLRGSPIVYLNKPIWNAE